MLIKGKMSKQILFFLFLPFLSYKIIKRLMITFPFPNIYLTFGHICCCCCCAFFFFFVGAICKTNNEWCRLHDPVFHWKVFKKSYLGQYAATNNETWQTEKLWGNSVPNLHLYMFFRSPIKSFLGKNQN